MTREVGDYYFNRMFPDQTQPPTPPRQPSFGNKVLKSLLGLGLESPKSSGEYEYKTVRVPGAKASARRNTRALNKLAVDGWEPVHVQPRGVLQFGTKDTVTLRRKL
jgi:hypothetical protein